MKKNIFKNYINCAIFVLASSIIWYFSNNYLIASEFGFDPVRYEYFAREGLPAELLLASSYRIVLLLQALYKFLPHYWGYIIFVIILLQLAINCSNENLIKIALYSPISFYYVAQTGKDWLSILALTCTFGLLRGGQRFVFILLSVFSISLILIIRPSLGPIFIILAIATKYGLKAALISSLLLGLVGREYINQIDLIEIHESTVAQEQSGDLVRIVREYTFGYGLLHVGTKFVLYSTALIYQPGLSIVKYINGGQHSLFILFEGCCLIAFLYIIVRKKMFISFVLTSLPFCAFLSITQSFFHFRYLLILYPIILICAIYAVSRSSLNHN